MTAIIRTQLSNCWHAFTTECSQIKQAVTSCNNSINESINFVTKEKIKHLSLTFATTVAFAYLHDFNIVLIYATIGIVFCKQVPDLSNNILNVLLAPYRIIDNFLLKSSDSYLLSSKLARLSLKITYGVGSIFCFALLSPITLLGAEAYVSITCGAALALICQKIVADTPT